MQPPPPPPSSRPFHREIYITSTVHRGSTVVLDPGDARPSKLSGGEHSQAQAAHARQPPPAEFIAEDDEVRDAHVESSKGVECSRVRVTCYCLFTSRPRQALARRAANGLTQFASYGASGFYLTYVNSLLGTPVGVRLKPAIFGFEGDDLNT
ncbi:hypothetical protein EVAR_24829_1 [Eumeta japonica]|uniref:Uncharacterized protein n=1 Tax=Eumeta variegata TaxID=151549 RepID=A0A4C1W416_EUMVA|nr:hypothetical protein EVAR_24829_1 [Eumeta japonica]